MIVSNNSINSSKSYDKLNHDKADEIISSNPGSFIFNQFKNNANPMAHYLTTGPEIFNDCKNVNFVFAGIGTGGTISGIGKYLKEVKPDTHIIGVEPEESPLITKGFACSHKIQGIGANFIPETYLNEYVDEVITVKGDEAIDCAKQIREIEDIDIGISSGAALKSALNYIEKFKINSGNIVVIFPDKGDRYKW